MKETNQIDLFNANQLDTSKWSGDKKINKPFVVYYHFSKSYNNYPVVTISYDNAINFCNWMTQQYNRDQSRKFKKVMSRLPTEKEWTLAASAGKENRIF